MAEYTRWMCPKCEWSTWEFNLPKLRYGGGKEYDLHCYACDRGELSVVTDKKEVFRQSWEQNERVKYEY